MSKVARVDADVYRALRGLQKKWRLKTVSDVVKRLLGMATA